MEMVLRSLNHATNCRADAANSSKSARSAVDPLPCHNTPITTGSKPGRGISRTFDDIFVLGIDTVKPIPKPFSTYVVTMSTELISMDGNQPPPRRFKPF